ncbi:MAG: AtpZ/AtpI family protein [Bacteroidota bacterium]
MSDDAPRDPHDSSRLSPEAGPPKQKDAWADAPDAWDEADRRWQRKWERREDSIEYAQVEPPSAAYRPQKTTAKSVASSYEDGMREAGPYLTIGLQIALSMLFFVGGGWALDEWAGTSPWGILIGTVLGFLGVMGLVIRLAAEADATKR